MEALEILRAEHGLIRQFLQAIAVAVERMEKGESLPREFFEHVVSFSREFVDKYHHFKEEYQVFALLAQKKTGELDNVLAGLRNQHEHGRNHVAEIDHSKEGYALGLESAATNLLEHLAAYCSMLRQHIHSEDHGVYQMADEALTGIEKAELLVEFQRADEKAGPGFLDESRDRVLKMEALLDEC